MVTRYGLLQKILTIAGILVLLLAITGIAGIRALDRARDTGRDTFRDATQPVAQLAEARSQLYERRILVREYILAPDRARRIQLGQEIEESGDAANEMLRNINLGSEEGEQVYTELLEQLEILDRHRAQAMQLAAAGNQAQARVLEAQQIGPSFDAVNESFEQLFKTKVDLAQTRNKQLDRAYVTERNVSLALIALSTLLGISIAWYLARGMQRALQSMVYALRSLNQNCIADIRAGMEGMARGDLTQEVRWVTKTIEDLPGDEIGDAGRTVNEIRDKIIATVGSYNQMRANLAATVGAVSATARELDGSAREVASMAEETGRVVGEITSAVGEMAEGAEQQVRMVDSVRGNTDLAARASAEGIDLGAEGVQAVTTASDTMTALSDSAMTVSESIDRLAGKSEQIGGIVGTITGIAEQTNLLALNAAIEAARAGDQGRGFAVVADEVRKLAEESQRAAGSIGDIIRQIQSDTARTVEIVKDTERLSHEGNLVVNQARTSFEQMGRTITSINGQISDILAATNEVATVAEQSSAATEEVSASTEEASASAEEMAATAHELSNMSERLNVLMHTFSVGHTTDAAKEDSVERAFDAERLRQHAQDYVPVGALSRTGNGKRQSG